MIAFRRAESARASLHAAPVCVGLALSSAYAFGIATAVLMPALCLRAQSRRGSYVSALSYYAGALWPLIAGANNFFGPSVSILVALALWGVSATLLALPWLLVWSVNTKQALWRAPAGLLLTVIPPLGIIGWASPLTAAGFLFPATGWCGLLGCALLTGALAAWPKQAVIAIAVASVIANLTHPTDPRPPADWLAIDTHFGSIAHRTPGPLAEYQVAEEIQKRALSAEASVIVFPETVVPYWTASTDEFWQPTLAALRMSGKTILIGTRIPRASIDPSRFYDFSGELAALRDAPVRALTIGPVAKSSWSPVYFNGVVIRGVKLGTFTQRIPVPIAMWNPFSPASVPMNVAGPGVITISGKRATILICYEQLIVWPVVTSMRQHPDVLLGVANDYWAAGTPIVRFQAAAVRSWARLFGIPCLVAVNT
jgi:hypothetical protein